MQAYLDDNGIRRLRGVELVIPICIGTVAWYLGKKQASDYNTHRWTVYMRGPRNEDLTHIISKVTFELHQTFNNPMRVMEVPPYEVTENGWGEFDIGVTMSFAQDSFERDVQLFHKLRLYDEGDSKAEPSMKRPVVTETYEELVIVDPSEALYNRVAALAPGPLQAQYTQQACFLQHSETAELEAIKECRAKLAQLAAGP